MRDHLVSSMQLYGVYLLTFEYIIGRFIDEYYRGVRVYLILVTLIYYQLYNVLVVCGERKLLVYLARISIYSVSANLVKYKTYFIWCVCVCLRAMDLFEKCVRKGSFPPPPPRAFFYEKRVNL